MHYLLRPGLELQFDDSPKGLVQIANEKGADLSEVLTWTSAERPVDDVLLRLALRYGAACKVGLTIAYENFASYSDLRRFMEIKPIKTHNHEIDQWIETQVPGWIARGKELDDRINEQHQERITRAVAEIEEALAAEPKAELNQHWTALGGFLPYPH